jgi:hypothetical protein
MIFERKNTTERGRVRCIIFREGDTWFGTALEFNLVVDAETKVDAFQKLDQAMKDYVDTVRIHHLRNNVLNQNTSSEYSKMWKDLNAGREPKLDRLSPDEDKRSQPSLEVAFVGFQPMPA